MEFARPHLFWLFLIYIPLIFWYVYKIRKIDPTIQASTLDAVKNFRTSYRVWLRHGLFAVRLLAIGCLIVILCRPQTSNKWETSSVEGTDIVIALDMSTSMLAKDFTPDRFAVGQHRPGGVCRREFHAAADDHRQVVAPQRSELRGDGTA